MNMYVTRGMKKFLAFVLTLISLILSGEGAPNFVWDGGKLAPRRLDPSRPWLKPENNWGQGFSNAVSKNRELAPRRLDPTRPHLKPGNNWGQDKSGSKPIFGTLDLKPGFGTKPFGKPGFGTKPFGKPGFGTKPFGKPGFGTKPFGKPGMTTFDMKPGFGTKPFGKPGMTTFDMKSGFGTKPFGKPGFGTKPFGKPGIGTKSGWKPGTLNTKPWAMPSGLTKDIKKGKPGNPWAGAGNPYTKPGFKYGGSAKDLKFSSVAGNPFTKDIKFGGPGNPWAKPGGFTKNVKLGGPGNPWAGASNPYTKPGKSPFVGGKVPCRPSRANNFCGKLAWKPAVVKPGEINLGKGGRHGISGIGKKPTPMV